MMALQHQQTAERRASEHLQTQQPSSVHLSQQRSGYHQTAAGAKQRPQEVRYRRIDQRLTQLKNRIIDADIHIMEYLDAASHLLHLG